MAFLHNLPEMLHVVLSDFSVFDVFDILIVAWIFYTLVRRLESTSAFRVAKGIVLLLAVTAFSGILGLDMLSYLLKSTIEVGLLALVIVFQPELRRLLERFGSRSWRELFIHEQGEEDMERVIEQTVAACETMSSDRTGVLLVFERDEKLDEYFKTGTLIDARVSAELLKNLFFTKAALHDGAVIVRDGRVAAAGCVLPLTINPNLNRDLGTRHRAGIGISEVSDAFVVIVSEETGIISVAEQGQLRRHLAPATLEKILKEELLPKEEEENRSVRMTLKRLQEKRNAKDTTRAEKENTK